MDGLDDLGKKIGTHLESGDTAAWVKAEYRDTSGEHQLRLMLRRKALL